ncbi:hypothetical protein KP509_11G000700 [Ceratopteris richardii]|nr:hypothetical protein KP509_11G000700 [Ceratopteris richardii]
MVVEFSLMLLWIAGLVINTWTQKTGMESVYVSGQVLTIVIPGVNMPWNNLPYMVLGIIIAVGFHELGHALAAASEGVPIEHVAVFLACLVPGALVALNQESLQVLSPIRSLRIYCAGIWHNAACCAACFLSLLFFQSIIPSLGMVNKPLMVSTINEDSPLAGYLEPGDSIISAGGIKLQKPKDWFEVFQNMSKEGLTYYHQTGNANISMQASHNVTRDISMQGFCVCSKSFQIHSEILPGLLCPNESLPFYEHLCTSSWPPNMNSAAQYIYCMRAVSVVECPPCSIKEGANQSCECSGSNACLLPLLDHGEAFVNVKVQKQNLKNCHMVKNDSVCEQNIIFVGDVEVLMRSVQLTYVSSPLGKLLGCLVNLLMYTFSVSAAMALLNSSLVFHLDGEHIFQSGLGLMKSWLPLRRRQRITHISMTIGTTLTVISLMISFVQFLI